MKNKTIFHLFFKESTKILTNIKNSDIKSDISKKTDITYAHCHNILNIYEEYGIVVFKNKGKLKKEVYLTKKGEFLKNKINSILDIKNGVGNRL